MSGKRDRGRIISIVLMSVLTVILVPILVINLTLIIKGSMGGIAPPDIFGVAPLSVASGSMDGDREDSFPQGSLIFISILSDEEKQNLSEGDIVTYYIEEEGIYVTHRITSVSRSDGVITSLITRGDANTSSEVVTLSSVVGKYLWHIAGLGDFAMFLQTPAGILVFVGIPVIAFIAYDVIRITLYNRKLAERDESVKALAEKDEEIARLKALVEERETSEGDEDPPDGQN